MAELNNFLKKAKHTGLYGLPESAEDMGCCRPHQRLAQHQRWALTHLRPKLQRYGDRKLKKQHKICAGCFTEVGPGPPSGASGLLEGTCYNRSAEPPTGLQAATSRQRHTNMERVPAFHS